MIHKEDEANQITKGHREIDASIPMCYTLYPRHITYLPCDAPQGHKSHGDANLY